MLTFKKAEEEDIDILRAYDEHCSYGLCEYSAGVLLMCRSLQAEYAIAHGCLVTKVLDGGSRRFYYPVPGEAGDVDAALAAVEAYCVQTELPLIWDAVPKDCVAALVLRYPYCRTENARLRQDYIYHAEDMRRFPGRHYCGQRNHIRRFHEQYPKALFRPLRAGDERALERFFSEYGQTLPAEAAAEREDLAGAKRLLRQWSHPAFCAGCVESEGRIIGVSLGEKCGGGMIVHCEKALSCYAGIYPAIVQSFAETFGGDAQWFNREDDAADAGLRTSKLQYRPACMGEKYSVFVENELYRLQSPPELRTERLLLRPFREEDIPAYYRLCTDDDNNRYWGYDYRTDLRGELTERYFFDVQRTDFEKRTAVNFAVTAGNRCIGEGIIYHFDMHGGAEVGFRIDPAFARRGYAKETLAALKHWALYVLGLRCLRAKCCRENLPSRAVLSAQMRPAGEDETFFYFEAGV